MARRKGVKWNVKQFEALREDSAVQADLRKRAERIADAAGGESKGYIVRENRAREGRAGVTVLATGHAHFSNRLHQSLVKALPKGR